jgi:hypothetical protein
MKVYKFQHQHEPTVRNEYVLKSDFDREIAFKDLEIKMLREQREKYAYRWSHNGDEFRQVIKDNDAEITQALKDLKETK